MPFQAYYIDDPTWRVAASGKDAQFDAWLESNRLSFVSCSESRQLGPVFDSSAAADQMKDSRSPFAVGEIRGASGHSAIALIQPLAGDHPTTAVAPTVGAISEVEAEMNRAALGLLQLSGEGGGVEVHSMSAMTKVVPESNAAIEGSLMDFGTLGTYDNAPAGSTALASAPSIGRVQSSSQPSPTVTSFHLFRPDVE